MNTYLFYRSNSEDEAKIRDLVREVGSKSDGKLKMMDTNTRDGSAMASLYDVMTTPSVIITAEDGRLIQETRGSLPLVSELTFYLNQ